MAQVVAADFTVGNIAQLRKIEDTIEDGDRQQRAGFETALRGRWTSGHLLLGLADWSVPLTWASERELRYRAKFAKVCPSETDFCNALQECDSWRNIIQTYLTQSDSQLRNSSESVEWFTPAKYIEAARRAMGSIDLDPASCEEANRTVRAARYYTEAQDGLTQPWYGNVWCNPPYGKSTGAFVERMVDAWFSREIKRGILLVNAHGTDTKWFARIAEFLLCFTDHRIAFNDEGQNTAGSIFAYIGGEDHLPAFVSHFSGFGPILINYGNS